MSLHSNHYKSFHMNAPGLESPRTLVIKPTLVRCLFTPAFLSPLVMAVLLLLAVDLKLRGAFFIKPLYIYSLVLLFLICLFRWLQTVSYSCFVTAQQMWIEQGILWKTTQFYELYRIRDYAESRSILDRLLGTMQLRLFTMDTNPFDLVVLKNIPHSSISMQIRERVQQSRKTNKMLFIENDAMR
jgi:membrane protein YdbS with pleckstrin-like domain